MVGAAAGLAGAGLGGDGEPGGAGVLEGGDLVDVAEGIQTITLHRPQKLNAFTPRMMRELIDAFAAADANDDVRAVIVTGAGRAFCAGADLSSGARTFERVEGGGRPVPKQDADDRVDRRCEPRGW